MSAVTHCYISREKDVPGCHAASADMPDMKKSTAKFVADEIRKGFIVERVPTEKAREMLGEYLEWREKSKASKTEGDLFSPNTL